MTQNLFWLIIWLIFCFSLFIVYIIFRLLEQFNQHLWIKRIKNSHLLVKKSKDFNKKYGEKITYTEFKKIVNATDFSELPKRPAWFELFERERIVFFEVPWGEVYCECNENEYVEIISYINNKFQESQTGG